MADHGAIARKDLGGYSTTTPGFYSPGVVTYITFLPTVDWTVTVTDMQGISKPLVF